MTSGSAGAGGPTDHSGAPQGRFPSGVTQRRDAATGGVPGDEVLALVRVAAALGAGGGAPLRTALEQATHLPEGAVDEVLLQSFLFLGYPAALNALALWREVSRREAPAPSGEHPGDWPGRGVEVCTAVYGGSYTALRENVRRMHPDMERWMVEEGYGRVLGRPGVPLPVRELCIVAVLALQPAPRQLHSHLRGALNTGADAGTVEAALEIAWSYDPAHREEGARVWALVRERWELSKAGTIGEEAS